MMPVDYIRLRQYWAGRNLNKVDLTYATYHPEAPLKWPLSRHRGYIRLTRELQADEDI